MATDESNSRNKMWNKRWNKQTTDETDDEIGVAVQSWLWVQVELMAW